MNSAPVCPEKEPDQPGLNHQTMEYSTLFFLKAQSNTDDFVKNVRMRPGQHGSLLGFSLCLFPVPDLCLMEPSGKTKKRKHRLPF